MGNRSTIPIDRFFETPIKINKEKSVCVHVILENAATGLGGHKIDNFIVEYKNGNLSFKDSIDSNPDYIWSPDSHMRDFEVFSKDVILARGQGIGVIILENVGAYIKIIYDRMVLCGVRSLYTMWNHSSTAKDILHNDLSMGYDVFFVNSEGIVYNLCEKRDDRDEKETRILLPEFEKYAWYEL